MSLFANVVALVGALAWPVLVLVLVLMFRRQLTSMLGRIRRVELPGGLAADLAATALLAAGPAPAGLTDTGPDFGPARRAAAGDPAQAVELAWQTVVETHNRVRGLALSPLRRTADAIIADAESGRLDRRFATVTDSLYELGRRAATTPDRVSATDALVYVQTAEELARALAATARS